jgi:predicted O-methyltransferase YrrM
MSARDEIRFAVEAVRRLPWPVARFVVRARSLARRDGDVFSLDSALRPAKLAVLLEAAAGRRTVVELGTGTAWATIALAIADPERTIESWDPVARLQREGYLDLAAPDVRRRITFVEGLGEDGPGAVGDVDLLFIDSSHEREPTLSEVATWRPVLAPGALVVFDDYGHPDYPGVAEAVAELGAVGEARASLYLWRLA